MTEITKYKSFDGKIFINKDTCLKHEMSILDKGVVLFEDNGRLLDLTIDNMLKAGYVYVATDVMPAFLAWINRRGSEDSNWYKIHHYTDDNYRLEPIDNEVRAIVLMNTLIEDKIEKLTLERKANDEG